MSAFIHILSPKNKLAARFYLKKEETNINIHQVLEKVFFLGFFQSKVATKTLKMIHNQLSSKDQILKAEKILCQLVSELWLKKTSLKVNIILCPTEQIKFEDYHFIIVDLEDLFLFPGLPQTLNYLFEINSLILNEEHLVPTIIHQIKNAPPSSNINQQKKSQNLPKILNAKHSIMHSVNKYRLKQSILFSMMEEDEYKKWLIESFIQINRDFLNSLENAADNRMGSETYFRMIYLILQKLLSLESLKSSSVLLEEFHYLTQQLMEVEDMDSKEALDLRVRILVISEYLLENYYYPKQNEGRE